MRSDVGSGRIKDREGVDLDVELLVGRELRVEQHEERNGQTAAANLRIKGRAGRHRRTIQRSRARSEKNE